jgi:predicted PP-loop superfamily ATPase
MKERWARDTPISGKKRFLPQNNDIPERTVTIGGGVDSSTFPSAHPPPSGKAAGHS